MFRRKIRPAQEEMRGTAFTVVFVLIWYASLMRGILYAGFQNTYLLFLAAGLLPVFTAVQGVRRALFYRRQGREIKGSGSATRGRIVNVIMKSEPYEDSHHRARYRRYYVLVAEVADPVTGVVNRIESPAYSRPIHRFLASPEVTVYTDRTGWKHYMDDFQWKERKSDPGIFEGDQVFDEYGTGALFGKVLVILVMLLMLYNIFFH